VTVDIEMAAPDHMVGLAVLVHPHPAMGGDRFNHVVATLFETLPDHGWGAARFDLSSSEPAEAAAQVEAVLERLGGPRLALVGYSFGADVSLSVAAAGLVGWAAVAPPLRFGDHDRVAADRRPKQLIVPERDQYRPPAEVRAITASWVAASVSTVPGADHFLQPGALEVAASVAEWLTGLSG